MECFCIILVAFSIALSICCLAGNFYNKDYFLSAENFEFILKEFKEEEIRHETGIWMARAQIEMGKFGLAKPFLNVLESDKELPQKLAGEFWAVKADYYLKQNDMERAIDPLTKAVALARKKKDRTRYMFILAQIHERTGDLATASELYGQVIKKNPPYDMAFNAKINRAKAFSAGAGDSKEISRELNKMLKDDKNKEYRDQIYFALANIELKNGNVDLAIVNYNYSIRESVNNNKQKRLSYLQLAELHFEKTDYHQAQKGTFNQCV